ncbi:MAG: T9SS type A sorting domain-containing protein [Bacteroidota bacterium]
MNVAPFEGMTVSQLLAVANQAIGGCGSSYSASELNAALTAINENYDNGNMDNGDLTCTPTYSSVKFSAAGTLSNNYPNPADAQASIALQLGEQTMVQIDVMDMSGRIVYTNSFMAEKGSNNYELNTKSLEEQIYLVRVTAGQKTEVKSFAVFH